MTGVVRVSRTLRAPVTEVFDAWTDAGRLKQWLNPRPGHAGRGGGSTGGRESQVTVTLRGKGETTEMTILHERLPAAEYRDGARRAWTAIAARLPAYLTGRLTRSDGCA
jgi:uncharacterized protein YndB with AHSA1/START domain